VAEVKDQRSEARCQRADVRGRMSEGKTSPKAKSEREIANRKFEISEAENAEGGGEWVSDSVSQ